MKKVHLVGIGGIGVSALAQIFLERGYAVSGSDQSLSDLTDELAKKGCVIYDQHAGGNVPEGCELVVYSEAISKNNPELRRARELNIPMKTCFEALGDISKDYLTIAISGTHGKTTTTALTALGLINAGLNPTVVIGTKMKEFGNTNVRFGDSKYFVVEACEYRESFLHLQPDILVVTNCDLDHLDYYRDEQHYREAFMKLIKKIPETGWLVIDASKPESKLLIESARCHILDVSKINTDLFSGLLQIPGRHNEENARFAYGVGQILQANEKDVREALLTFEGSWRRFERKKTNNGVIVIDDYGHHPAEIQATLQAARDLFPAKKIFCVFQPHQYSRTIKFLAEFAQSFHKADVVIIPNIYEARDTEEDKKNMNTTILVKAISEHHSEVIDGKGLIQSLGLIRSLMQPGNVVIIMGAGDVFEITEKLTNS